MRGSRYDITNADIAPIDDDHHAACETSTQKQQQSNRTNGSKKQSWIAWNLLSSKWNKFYRMTWAHLSISCQLAERIVPFTDDDHSEGRTNVYGKSSERDGSVIVKRWNIYKLWIAIKVIPQHKAAFDVWYVSAVCFGNDCGNWGDMKIAWLKQIICAAFVNTLVTNGGYEIVCTISVFFFKRFPKNGVK